MLTILLIAFIFGGVVVVAAIALSPIWFSAFMNGLFRLGYVLDLHSQTAAAYKLGIWYLDKVLHTRGALMGAHLANLAMLYNAEGQYEKAEPLYKQAILLFRQSTGGIADAQDNAGDAAGPVRIDPAEALRWLEPITIVLEDYASLLEITGRSSEAALVLRDAADRLSSSSFETQAATLRERAQKISKN
jgi:hypothetical protein